MADKGIQDGTKLVEETRKVVQKLYDDKLLVGQKSNRPTLPAPEQDEAGGFFSLFFAKGNQTTTVDRTFAEMWEQHVARYMKGLQHVNPGGWTYSHGWSDLMKDQAIINEQDTLLREKAAMEQRLQKLEGKAQGTGKTSSYRNGPAPLYADVMEDPVLASGGLALLGGGLLLTGLRSRSRNRNRNRHAKDAARAQGPR